MIYQFQEFCPRVSETAFIADTAVLIGRATVGEHSSIWFNTVVRADINTISIGESTNIQDGCTLHVTREDGVMVEDRVTVGHGVILHGCTIESDCLIAMGSVVLDGVRVGKGSVVAAGAVVAPGTEVPEDSLIMGIPARVVRKVHDRDKKRFERNWRNYVEYAELYSQETTLTRID